MVRAVVFHHNHQVRERVVDAFRHAGIITYDAVDPQHAFTAAWTYHPHVVITDFPAMLEDGRQSRTLTQAIRESPALRDVAVLNLGGDGSEAAARDAAQAGATATLPPSTPPAEIIRAVNEISRRSPRG
jgi:DNA-binding NarL/FixJ family response regulator